MSNSIDPLGYDHTDTPAGLAQTQPPGQPASGVATAPSDIAPYVVPMVTYVALSSLEGYLPTALGQPSSTWYPPAYAGKLLIVALLAWHYRATWNDFRPLPSLGKIILGILTGILVWGAWIGLDGRYPALPLLGTRSAFDPQKLAPLARWAFIALRLLGLVVVVPVFEELFWRSFLMRWLIDSEFLRVPIGKVTPMAAAVTSVLFALVHPEWLPALLTGALWAWLLWCTRSLSVCAISHAVANLALGVYVITTHDWKFW
jgi:CAAX prenyl protease-like protein